MSETKGNLRIFIIGGRLGESIVIQTPAGRFGVVDAYCRQPGDPENHPTLCRLQALGAAQLQFIALTHPHMDHFRGLGDIFERYSQKIAEFWRHPFGSMNFSSFIETFRDEFKAETSPDRQERIAEKIRLYRKIMTLVEKEKNTGMNTITTQDHRVLLQEKEHDFEIVCIGPSTNVIDLYQKEMCRKIAKDRSLHISTCHNLASSVLEIRFGTWVGVLGGDTEQRSWNDILERNRQQRVSSAQFIKVSHHGSPTGSYKKLWDSLQSQECDAVLTCFAAQGLPKNKGLKPIWNKGYSVHSTNKGLAIDLVLRRKAAEKEAPDIKLLPGLQRDPQTGEVEIIVNQNGTHSFCYHGPAGRLEPSASKHVHTIAKKTGTSNPLPKKQKNR